MGEIKKVLVIEDDSVERQVLLQALKNSGYVSYGAQTGEEGLTLFKKVKPDVVLLDVVLPGIDGWDVLKKIKSGPLSRKVPVIMITAKSENTDRITGYEIGADFYVTKPYNISKLLPIIRNIVSEK
ncbi:MAG TPA: response regulator [bacterium]|nr:response regulator [bacterium]